jgi:hypothetical protein
VRTIELKYNSQYKQGNQLLVVDWNDMILVVREIDILWKVQGPMLDSIRFFYSEVCLGPIISGSQQTQCIKSSVLQQSCKSAVLQISSPF